jgi:hypothetical protein
MAVLKVNHLTGLSPTRRQTALLALFAGSMITGDT